MKNWLNNRQGALLLALLVISGCSQPTPRSSMLLGGDVMLARAGEVMFSNAEPSVSPWGELRDVMREMPVDAFAINLESPLGVLGSEVETDHLSMNLCAPESQAGLLLQGGVTLATNANNHAADCEGSDPDNTVSVLNAAGIGIPSEAYVPLFVQINGQKVAIISANDTVGELDLDTLLRVVASVRDECGLVVVSMHWGNEYQAGPSQHQQSIAQQLVDAGADILWGHHPHVLQRVEWLPAASGEREGLVIYSLGNLLSDQWMLTDALQTALIKVEFYNHQITSIVVIPMKMQRETKSLVLVQNAEGVGWVSDRLRLSELIRDEIPVTIFQADREN